MAMPGKYTARLTEEYAPRLYINEIYKRMAKTKSVDGKTREFIANNIRNARWLGRGLAQMMAGGRWQRQALPLQPR